MNSRVSLVPAPRFVGTAVEPTMSAPNVIRSQSSGGSPTLPSQWRKRGWVRITSAGPRGKLFTEADSAAPQAVEPHGDRYLRRALCASLRVSRLSNASPDAALRF